MDDMTLDFKLMKISWKNSNSTLNLVEIKGDVYVHNRAGYAPQLLWNTGNKRFDEMALKAWQDFTFERDILNSKQD